MRGGVSRVRGEGVRGGGGEGVRGGAVRVIEGIRGRRRRGR